MTIETINRQFYLKIIGFHIFTTTIAALGMAYLSVAPSYLQFVSGSALGALNILLLVWGMHRALVKKSFALVAVTSVFKYGLLIFLFWYAMQMRQRVGYEFIIGVTLIFPSVVFMSYLMKNETNGTF